MNWSFDLSQAPRGRHEVRTRTVKDEAQEYTVFIPERVLLAHPRDGQVYATYWLEPTKFTPKGRWAGWREGDEALAWMAYPDYPIANQVAAKTDIPEVAGHWDEADVGSGS